MSDVTLSLADGARIVVPDVHDHVTPYVLHEQGDWFEDEIRFLRAWLQPGMRAIDIGANYGVYTLTIAHAVGANGAVWAFEPATRTAGYLARSVAANRFGQVHLEQSAVSSERGSARLALDSNPELNAITRGERTGDAEIVALVTLDDRRAHYGWQDIDFLKIDAEGEEANILSGGARFFAECSPLVQFEVKAVDRVNLELVDRFAALGYRSFRLVPGLDLLVPFDRGVPPDTYLLNLFCAKPDRVRALAAAGRLVEQLVPVRAAASYDWRTQLLPLPYAQRLAGHWAAHATPEVTEALALYAQSRDAECPAEARFAALDAAITKMNALCGPQPARLRLASLARMARDHGARALAVTALQFLSRTILRTNRVDTDEPFLAPLARFDTLDCGDALGNWMLAATLEALERLEQHSSFYARPETRTRLAMIRDLGFGDAQMARRLELMAARGR